jgi:hypothetical protein
LRIFWSDRFSVGFSSNSINKEAGQRTAEKGREGELTVQVAAVRPSDASDVSNSSAIFVVVLAPLLLGERLFARNAVAACVGFVGVLLVS